VLGIFAITTPIFLLIGIGYLAVMLRLLDKSQVQSLGGFVINFALPALIATAAIVIASVPMLSIYPIIGHHGLLIIKRPGTVVITNPMRCIIASSAQVEITSYPILWPLFIERASHLHG